MEIVNNGDQPLSTQGDAAASKEKLGSTINLSLEHLNNEGGPSNISEDSDDLHEIQTADDLNEPNSEDDDLEATAETDEEALDDAEQDETVILDEESAENPENNS